MKNDYENSNTLALGVGTFAKGEVGRSHGVSILWKKVFRCAPNYLMVLGLELCVDPLCFGSNMHVRL